MTDSAKCQMLRGRGRGKIQTTVRLKSKPGVTGQTNFCLVVLTDHIVALICLYIRESQRVLNMRCSVPAAAAAGSPNRGEAKFQTWYNGSGKFLLSGFGEFQVTIHWKYGCIFITLRR